MSAKPVPFSGSSPSSLVASRTSDTPVIAGARPFTDMDPLYFMVSAVAGGAATLLELPLDPAKELKSITVKALSNDVVIGLMSLTLIPSEQPSAVY